MNKQNVPYPYKRILHLVVKRNNVLTRGAVWMDLSNIMQSEGRQAQKTTYFTVHFYDMFRIGKSVEIESRLVVARDLGRGKNGIACKRVSF